MRRSADNYIFTLGRVFSFSVGQRNQFGGLLLLTSWLGCGWWHVRGLVEGHYSPLRLRERCVEPYRQGAVSQVRVNEHHAEPDSSVHDGEIGGSLGLSPGRSTRRDLSSAVARATELSSGP